MQILRTYKFKLYHSKKNKKLNQKIDTAAWVYNHCIALSRRYYSMFGKTINFYVLMKHIARLRRTNKPEWKNLNSQTIQDIVQRVERSYRSFFKLQKYGFKRARLPHFVKRERYKSITYKQAGWKLLDDNRIRLDGIVYKYWQSRKFDGQIKIITLKRDYRGHLFLYFVVLEDIKSDLLRTGNTAGFDFGLKHFLTNSNGNTIDVPRAFLKHKAALRKAQQRLSKKQKGSIRRKKVMKKLNDLHTKVVNSRSDWQYKLANKLVKEFDTLVFEDLNFKGMARLWGKKLNDLAPSEFFNKIEWVALKNDKEVIFIDRWFPSTKLCHVCGSLNEQLTLKDRVWTCACGTIHNRDVNAAINILREGTSSRELDGSKSKSVRLAAVA